jgi:hypothetical protein
VSLRDRVALHRCMKRLQKAEGLLTWVENECDLSGQMELAAAIRKFLGMA